MDSKYPHDEDLYKRIRAGDEKLQNELFHKYWKKFYGFVIKKKHKLDKDSILDIYVDSFIIFLKNIRNAKLKLPLKSTLETYLFAIGLKMILKYFDGLNKDKEDPVEDIENFQKSKEESELEEEEQLKGMLDLLEKILSKSSDSCKRLLKLWFKGYSHEAIAKELNLDSAGSSRGALFKCLKKIRDDDDLRKDFEDLLNN